MKHDVDTPKAYRDGLSEDDRALVDHVRAAIFDVAPSVEEGVRYGMLDYPGLANLAAQKRYVSLYVAAEVLARHAAAFPGVDRGKSCLRFVRIAQADPAALRALLEDVRAYRARGD